MKKNKVKYVGMSTLEVLVEARNYNRWIASEIIPYLKTTVLEIGAGTGNLTEHCMTNKKFVVTDNDRGLVTHLRGKFKKHKNVSVAVLDISRKLPQKFSNSVSSVYAINVLEHIEDDAKALLNVKKMLKKNGRVILLVPAKKFAYTKLDRELGHFRRYEKKEMNELMKKTGLQIENIKFFNIVGLMSWYFRAKVKKNNIQLKPYHIKIFDSIVPVLRMLERFVPMPAGISIIVVAKKV